MAQAHPVNAVVVIPTYNEAENIEPVVERTLAAAPEAEVLIVDDNSPDGTGEIGDKLAELHDEVHVLHRDRKEGFGVAYRAGFGWALEHGYEAVVEMDADGSHQPEDLPRLLHGLDEADIAMGSRWVPGGRAENWPWHRSFLSRSREPLCPPSVGAEASRRHRRISAPSAVRRLSDLIATH